MTNKQEKLLRGKLTKWLQAKGETPEDVERKTNAWLQYFDGIKKPVVVLAACTWLCSGAVILPEDMPKVEQAVKVAEINRVDPLLFDRPMAVFEAFSSTELKETPIDPDTVPTLHLARRFDSGLAIYDVDESQESRENMRRIINTHFGKDSSPWCLLQGDGEGNLTEDSLGYWNHYNAYAKQVAFVDGKLVAFSANYFSKKIWWDRMDECHEGIVVLGRVKGDPLGRSAQHVYDPETGRARYENIIRRHDDVFVERYADIADRDYTLDILVDPERKDKIVSVVIPEGVKVIGEGIDHLNREIRDLRHGAFEDCFKMEVVHLPKSLEEIGDKTFAGCVSMTEAHVPEGVKVIGDCAFYGCVSLEVVHLPKSLEEIGDKTFAGCVSMTEAHVPEGVKVIGDCAFYGCVSLEVAHLPSSLEEIGLRTFSGCCSMKEAYIPEGVKVIGDCAFYGCVSLEVAHLPNSLKEIGYKTFAGCVSMKEAYIPNSVEVIGDSAYEFCTSMKKVYIPEGVRYIGEDAFYGCKSLEVAYIPNSVMRSPWSIGLAFRRCISLREVHVSATAPQALIDTIREVVPGGCTILRDLPEEDLSALDGLGLSKEDIDVLSKTGCFKVEDFDFVIRDDGRVWCRSGETAVRLEDAIKQIEEEVSQEEGASQSKGLRM